MTEWTITPRPVEVAEAEYRRLLGYPPGAEWSERARELAAWARAWFGGNGRPWVYAREAGSLALAGDAVEIEGVPFRAGRLRTALAEAEAHTVFLAAASAGAEAEMEAARLWTEGRPDEYFFLEMFASAVVEHLVMLAGARLCAWADERRMAVLPHSSPGYAQWDAAEQPALLRLIRFGAALPGPLGAFDSGALVPKKSQLAVFGVTRAVERMARLADAIPCRHCALANCQYRRAPHARTPRYTVPAAALRRWAAERLAVNRRADGSIHARFRYDGVTCTNLGAPLAFDYEVTLGPREQGYPVCAQRCAPAPGDSGYKAMCRHIADDPGLMAAIEREAPLAGRPLADVFGWHRAGPGAGCYCEAPSRDHKWGLVLETVHYALDDSENHEAKP